MNGSMPKVYGTNFGLALPTELLGKVILVAKFPMEMKVDKEVERPVPPHNFQFSTFQPDIYFRIFPSLPDFGRMSANDGS